MAIIRSTAVGKGRKSVGEFTYRHSRGRTIASSRVTTNNSKTPNQVRQRTAFGDMATIAKTLAPWINQAFPKTKYGSSRNNFIKSNNQLLQILKEQPAIMQESRNGLEALDKIISEQAVQLCAAQGPAAVTFHIENGQIYTLVSSRALQAGDVIRILIATGYTIPAFPDLYQEQVKILEYTVTPEKLKQSADPNQITISEEELPQLGEISSLYPPEAEILPGVTAVSITSNRETCKSYFQSFTEGLPVLTYEDAKMMNGSDTKVIVSIQNYKNKQSFISNLLNAWIGDLTRAPFYKIIGVMKNEEGLFNELVVENDTQSKIEDPWIHDEPGKITFEGEVIGLTTNILTGINF